MDRTDSRICLCGESTGHHYAPGHDALHASELALAVYEGALPESVAINLIPTSDTKTRFEEILTSRRNYSYRGGITLWGSWLDRLIDGNHM